MKETSRLTGTHRLIVRRHPEQGWTDDRDPAEWPVPARPPDHRVHVEIELGTRGPAPRGGRPAGTGSRLVSTPTQWRLIRGP